MSYELPLSSQVEKEEAIILDKIMKEPGTLNDDSVLVDLGLVKNRSVLLYKLVYNRALLVLGVRADN